jgi:hypothetical protein
VEACSEIRKQSSPARWASDGRDRGSRA